MLVMFRPQCCASDRTTLVSTVFNYTMFPWRWVWWRWRWWWCSLAALITSISALTPQGYIASLLYTRVMRCWKLLCTHTYTRTEFLRVTWLPCIEGVWLTLTEAQPKSSVPPESTELQGQLNETSASFLNTHIVFCGIIADPETSSNIDFTSLALAKLNCITRKPEVYTNE